MNNKVTVIYIMGAGRSGTTILTTLLGGSSLIFSTADLMQVYDYKSQDKTCGNGVKFSKSEFWKSVFKCFPVEYNNNASNIAKRNHKIEHHKAALSTILGIYNRNVVTPYLEEQAKLFFAISKVSDKNIIVDSSKYPVRGLLFNMLNENIDVKYIYNIRDVRGVVNSFSKKVQTPRNALSTIYYYFVINVITQVIFWMLPNKNKIKVRYEDLMVNHHDVFASLSELLNIPFRDVIDKLDNNESFDIGPVIEGNRMVKNRKVKLKYDNCWQFNLSRFKQIIFYILTAPLMIINRYKI
jgi:hypothetical protein